MKLSAVPVSLALSLAAFASASPQSSQSLDSVSVLEVLATALPQSLINVAITNPAKASSIISSEFAHSETPGWYSKLPSPIQTYLVPVTTVSQAPSGILSGLPSEITSFASVTYSPIPKPMNISTNATMTMTKKTTSRMSHITTHKSSSSMKMTTPTTTSTRSTSSAGASVPTALFGAGIAGVVGVVGLFAL